MVTDNQSRKKIKNLDDLILRLKPFLKDYLREKGINTSKRFTCINPEHEDKHPSMLLHRSGTFAKCFSCNSVCDIFQAVHLIEAKPITGKGFVKETIPYLCDKYGVKIQFTDFNEKDFDRINALRAYKVAYEYILSFWHTYSPENDSNIQLELDNRNWTIDSMIEFGVGFIRDFKDFDKTLKQHGFNPNFLDKIDLSHRIKKGQSRELRKPNPMFTQGLDGMIFTFKDYRGNPVGFITRNLKFTKENKKEHIKFINTETTQIFKKGELLQNLHTVIKKGFNKVYLVEGFGDMITMTQNGISNVVSPISTAVTSTHVEALRHYGINEVILSLDGDEPGQKNIQRIMDNHFAGCYDLNVKVLNYDKPLDPDEYIRTYGVDKFKSLYVSNGFEWRLTRQLRLNSNEEITSENIEPLLKLVVNESSWIKRDEMVRVLAKYTNYKELWLRKEVERLSNIKDSKIEAKRNEVINQTIEQIQKSPQHAEQLFDEAKEKLNNITDAINTDPLNPVHTIELIRTIQEENAKKSKELPGLKTGFKLFDQAHNGIRETGALNVFGGIASTGKTAFIAQLVYNLAKYNDNLFIILHTTDDSLVEFVPRLICIDQYIKSFEETGQHLILNGVMYPEYYYSDIPAMKDFINDGYNNIIKLIREERLELKDMTERQDAKTISYGEMLVHKAKERYPNRPILYILDNFHKCLDYPRLDERIRFKRMSGDVKDICQKHSISAICTMEYNKIYERREPRNTDLSETGKMFYDLNLLYHLHNEYKAYDGDTRLYWNDYSDTEEVLDNTGNVTKRAKRKPIIKAINGKSKVSDSSETLYFQFDPPCNHYTELSPTEVSRIMSNQNATENTGDNLF